MKHFLLIAAFFTAALLLSADEREELRKTFEKETLAAETALREAESTVELTAAAGQLRLLAEKQLYRALDWRLRHTVSAAERERLLTDLFLLGGEVQSLLKTPREELGSLGGMRIYCAASELLQRATEILMLDEMDGARWEKIANCTLVLQENEQIELKRGKASFQRVLHGQKVTLQILLFPKDTFTYQGRDFAVLCANVPFAVNNSFSSAYLCERKNGKLLLHTRCRTPYVSRWILQGKSLLILDGTKEEIPL